ncbi:MAG: xanthine dehydrogenase accessory protein XdhC [Acidiphilium sp.]|nr:xanthine dehydrogenase accessory protein XdhC [Acidiphilium sp.]MDD4936286.1 xanthine dehydrogenase accessory protein XdhC [Acidiphilium sp.]
MSPRAVSVAVDAVRGSAPREAGARMLVFADGTEGSIGGGALEYAAIGQARTLLGLWQTQGATPHRETRALGPQLGQCCGGSVTLVYEPWLACRLPPSPPLFHLQLHGAGHVGRALIGVLATLPVTIDWIDQRADIFPPEPPQGRARLRCRRVEIPQTAVVDAPPGARFLVMTHSHALDFAVCAAVLRRGDADFVGLIGSRTKHARFVGRWRAAGIADGAIDRLTCPIGLPGITDKRPEIIAVAVAAQLLLPGTNPPARPVAKESATCPDCALVCA